MLYVCVYVCVRVTVRIYKHMLFALTLYCMYTCICILTVFVFIIVFSYEFVLYMFVNVFKNALQYTEEIKV